MTDHKQAMFTPRIAITGVAMAVIAIAAMLGATWLGSECGNVFGWIHERIDRSVEAILRLAARAPAPYR